MATVPSYGEPKVSARAPAAVYQDGSAPLDAFGSDGRQLLAAGQRIGAASDELAATLIKNQQEDNERELKDLQTKQRQFVMASFSGDGTEQNPGYFSLKGENALAGAQGVKDNIEKHRQELLKSASNERVRQDFALVSAEDQLQDYERVQYHVNDQRKIANEAASEARKGTAIDRAANGWNDPQELAEAIATVNGENFEQAQRLGLPAEVLKFNMQRDQSLVYTAAIKAAMGQDPDAAVKLFEKVSPLIDPQTRAQLKNVLDEATIDAAAQSIAEDALARTGGNYAKARELIRSEQAGKKEKAGISELNARRDERERDYNIWRQHKADAEADAEKDVLKTGIDEAFNYLGATEDPQAAIDALETDYRDGDWTAKEYKAIRQELLAQKQMLQSEEDRQKRVADEAQQKVDRQERQAEDARRDKAREAGIALNRYVAGGGDPTQWMLENPDPYNDLLNWTDGAIKFEAAKGRANEIAEGKLYAPISDGITLQNFKQLPADAQLQADLIGMQGKLTKSEYIQAQNVQNAARVAIEKAGAANASIYDEIDKRVNDLAPKKFVNGQNKATLSAASLNEVKADMRVWAQQFTAAGKTITEADLTKETTRLLLKVTQPGRLWGTNPAGIVAERNDLTPDEQAKYEVEKYGISLRDFLQIVNAMDKVGRGNDQQLLDGLIKAYKAGDAATVKSLLGVGAQK